MEVIKPISNTFEKKPKIIVDKFSQQGWGKDLNVFFRRFCVCQEAFSPQLDYILDCSRVDSYVTHKKTAQTLKIDTFLNHFNALNPVRVLVCYFTTKVVRPGLGVSGGRV